jgi:hypothetical protein
VSESTLYGPQQSRFARYLERREQRRPDLIAREIRRRVLAGLTGEVIEVGSGDGRSFEHYPAEVSRLVAVEPDPAARATAKPRAEAASFPIEIVDSDAAALPADASAFDAAVVMGLLTPLLGARSVGERRVPRRSARRRSALLDEVARRLRDDARHPRRHPRGRVRDRVGRPRFPLVVALDDYVCAVRARGRSGLKKSSTSARSSTSGHDGSESSRCCP